jgi:DNA-binding winged helix-turn-helix (wHTH) protein
MLRKAFSGAEYIETISRRGYRFIGDVREWSETPPKS